MKAGIFVWNHLSTFFKGSQVWLFLGYGFACICFGGMQAEFERYKLTALRHWIGLLEILGGLGLLLGFYFPLLTLIASAGLGFLMLAGVIVRWRLGDTWIQKAPAAVIGAVNFFLFLSSLAIIPGG